MQLQHCVYCMKGTIEYNNKVYICYVDYEKAFDRVDWIKLMTTILYK